MEEIVGTVENRYLARPEVEQMFAVALPDNPIIGVIVKQEYSEKERMLEFTKQLQQTAFGVPGVSFPIVFQVPLFATRGGLVSGDLDVTIRGPDLDVIQGIASRIQGGAWGIAEEAGIRFVQSTYEPGLPEMQVRTNREKAAAVGLAVSDVGYAVGTVVDGTLAGEFRERGREIDITLIGEKDTRTHTQRVLTAPIVTPRGDLVNLGDVADLDITTGPATIQHTDLDRSVTVAIRINPTVPLDQARDVLLSKVVNPARQDLPGLDYTIDLIGKARDLDLTWIAVRGSFLLAIVIVYLLMSALFESFASPFVIILSVPMALTGGVLGVALARASDPTVKMDVITMLGFVILAGVVVNNAILIVHQALNNIRTGMERRAAVLESVRSRIRPIFMSTTTSIMGMLPLVLSGGTGTELYRGLGAVVVGGLALSTFFTLFLIPAMFSLSLDFRAFLTSHFGWKPLEEALREAHTFKAIDE
jgi:HAE1 family hydrophobic/amphiphilic exporter-1